MGEARFDAVVCPCDLGQGELPPLPWRERAFLEQVTDVLGGRGELAQVSIADGEAEHGPFTRVQRAHRNAHLSVHAGNRDDPAATCQRVDGGRQIPPSGGVELDVDAVWGGVPQVLLRVAIPVIDGEVGAKRSAVVAVLRARRGDDARA